MAVQKFSHFFRAPFSHFFFRIFEYLYKILCNCTDDEQILRKFCKNKILLLNKKMSNFSIKLKFLSFLQISRYALFWCNICLGLSPILSTAFARSGWPGGAFFICVIFSKSSTGKDTEITSFFRSNEIYLFRAQLDFYQTQYLIYWSNFEFVKRRPIVTMLRLLQI